VGSDDFEARFIAPIDKMSAEMEEARAVSREVIFRVVVLSSAIVAFSATLLSIDTLSIDVNRSMLRVAWLLFAVVVAIGPISVFLESRAKYAVTWRAKQAMEFDQPAATRSEHLKIVAVLLYTVLVRPRNLIFVRHSDYGDKRKAWLNGVVVQRLHTVWDFGLALELAFWAAFVAALVVLIVSVGL
jgi:hypothetical protein